MAYDPRLPLLGVQPRIKSPLESQADVLGVQERQLGMRQQLQAAQDDQQLRGALQAHLAEGGDPNDVPSLLKRIYPINPMLGMKLHQQWQQEQSKQSEASWRSQRERHDAQKARMELLQAAHGQLARVLDLPDEEQEAAYATAVDDLINTGVADADQIPRTFNRSLVKTWRDALKKEVDRVSLHAGVLSPETGQPGMGVYEGAKLLRVDPMAPGGDKLGSDYHQGLVRFAASLGKKVEDLTPAEELKWRKQYGQADDAAQRPWAPVVIQTAEGPQLLNRNTNTAQSIGQKSGGSVQPAPTAGMRDKAEGRARAAQSIGAVKALGDRIITRVGPGQRLDALARGAAAVFGSDPDFRTYQDARKALAGNLAVAQQGSRPSDADIEAIWMPMVPDPYRDTKESAAAKWRLIDTMISGKAASEETGGGWTDVGGGFKVRKKQ